MKNVIRKVIESKNYELSDMLKKIDTLWVQGNITEDEKNEFSTMARSNASMQNSLNVISQLEELNKRLVALEKELKSLGEEVKALKGDETETETEKIVPQFETGKWYYSGDKVSFEGNTYLCTAPEDVACVWSPKDYPQYWEQLL